MGRPTGVTVLAVLDFIGAGFCVLAGIGMLLGGGFIASMMSQQQGASAGLLAAIGAAAGVFILLCAAIAALLGWGLLKLMNWARITTIVLAALGVIFGLFGLVGALGHFAAGVMFFTLCRIAINGVIIWYLLQPNVKTAFEGAQARAVGA
jgi:cbb3-type cytochrome oxidase subunit 3